MVRLETIKLIVWDLDETFWSGTLSEGIVSAPGKNIQLVKDLTDNGVINSICSKNDFESAKRILQDIGVWDLFVFPSINWESKGPQLKDKLDKMALRPVNVLFLDDNPSNLGEAKHYLPEIQTGGPELIPELIAQAKSLEKKDPSHKRLKQYKILEEKDTASKSYSSSEDFLYDSNIQVRILDDCLNQIKRIHELLLRSNQLNYTKKRISIDELESILKDSDYQCGYVTVKDRFGDYGVIGFYALKENHLDHFLFSCRTMGQKIEQWVYAHLGFPELDIIGEVRTKLNDHECPGWINQTTQRLERSLSETSCPSSGYRILIKGPCDLSHALVYIKGSDRFDTEFTYVSNAEGQIIDAYNHSVHIEGLYSYSEEEKTELCQDCFFIDPKMLSGSFFTNGYDVIVLSTLIESTYQIYRKKGTDLKVVFGGLDLTDSDNWDAYINNTTYTGGNRFTAEFLKTFAKEYECIGLTTPEMYIAFLEKCLQWLDPKTHLCLVLGATKYDDTEGARLRHVYLNQAIKEYADCHSRIHFIEIDDCIQDQSDFLGGINHFSSRVYYEIAQRITYQIQRITGEKLSTFSSRVVYLDSLTLWIRTHLKRIVKNDSSVYTILKKVYDRVYKHRQ